MFCLKKALMTKIMNKRKKNKPFDYEAAESFDFTKSGDGTINNSYYFSAHSSKKNQSLYVRLGLRDNGVAEVWVYFDDDKKSYFHNHLLYPKDSAPLKVYRENGQWAFSFEGALVDDDGKDVPAKLDCNFNSNSQPVDFFYHMPSTRIATALSQDKWSKEYFEGFKENDSVHYEQEGKLFGTLILGEEEFTLDLPCLRDHSFGKRVWGYMNNHLWLAATDEDCFFNFSMVSYPSMSILEVGHVRERENPIEYVKRAHYDRLEIVQNKIPETLQLEVKTTTKRKISVTAKLLRYVPYVFEDGAYTLIEGIADYDVDGIKCRGILEIGFNKDTSRFMNGKKIESIRD